MKRELFKKPEEEVKERGPVFYEEKEGKKFVNIAGIRVETFASQEEIESILKERLMTKEFVEMLQDMATTYKLRQPLLIEGGTAIGKTLAVNTFNSLVNGKEIEPIDFYCSGQTDVSELMGKWVPATSKKDQLTFEKYLQDTEEGQAFIKKLYQEIPVMRKGPEEIKKIITKNLSEKAKSLRLDVKESEWTFQFGAIPKGALEYNPRISPDEKSRENQGLIIHIQEVGLAEPQVINALLTIRGIRGELASQFQLWQNGGELIKLGKRCWVVFSTNPPEEYKTRHTIDEALARAVVYKRMGYLSQETERSLSRFAWSYSQEAPRPEEMPYHIVAERPIDLKRAQEIAKVLERVQLAFHQGFRKAIEDGRIDHEREQKIPLTPDEFFRVATFMQNMQTEDLIESFKKAVKLYYIDRLAEEKDKEDMMRLLRELLGLKLVKRRDAKGNEIEVEVEATEEDEMKLSPQIKLTQRTAVQEIKKLIEEMDPKIRFGRVMDEVEKSAKKAEDLFVDV